MADKRPPAQCYGGQAPAVAMLWRTSARRRNAMADKRPPSQRYGGQAPAVAE